MRHDCFILGCPEPGLIAFTVRLRRTDSTALVAPNTGAWLCERHAEAGIEADIVIRPRRHRKVELYAWCEVGDNQGAAIHTVTPITAKAARGTYEKRSNTGDPQRRGRVQRPRR